MALYWGELELVGLLEEVNSKRDLIKGRSVQCTEIDIVEFGIDDPWVSAVELEASFECISGFGFFVFFQMAFD